MKRTGSAWRWNKRVSAALACVILLSLLCGCAGGGASDPRPTDAPNEAAVVTETPQTETQPGETAAPTDDASSGETRILVAYFSATGHTAPIAEYAAELLGADIYEIVAAEPYTEADLAYYTGGRCDREQEDPSVRPAIAGSVENMDEYYVILIGHPIWHGQAPRIISTFLESYDLSGKTLVTFCTSASSGLGSSASNLYGLVPDSVTWLESRRFVIGSSKDEVAAWLREIGLYEAAGREEASMKMSIDGVPITVEWEDNESVSALMDIVRGSGLTINTSAYGGFEQVGPIGQSLPRNDLQITTQPGDIVLYSGDQIVIFYGSNSWAYTRLGRITDKTSEELAELLSGESVSITLYFE